MVAAEARQFRNRRLMRWPAGLAAIALLPSLGLAPAAAQDQDVDGPSSDVGVLQDKATPEVRETLSSDSEADILIGLEEQADLSGAATITDWAERGEHVVDELQATAARSQQPVIEVLEDAGADYEAYWIVNAVLVRGASTELAKQLAGEPMVSGLFEVTTYEAPELSPTDLTVQADNVEWGLEAIGADQVWAEIGVRGEDIVVGNIDTGVDFDHPDLLARYRGSGADGTVTHDYNWFDPTGICATTAPCDNHGHGTHTMGTMVGGDAGGTAIGVAPNARWIAAKGCEAQGLTGCTTPSLIASGQWMLAPTDANGANPRTDLRPHIINNSWGSNTRDQHDPFYNQIIDAWNSAGIFTAFSNGNDGNAGCSTTGSPADAPQAYAVGAHDSENIIAPFSSRGPAPDGEIRPNLAAPGVAIRSSIPGGYSPANGTSMAAPHVAGTVALMWSAAPSLIGDVESTRELLDQTAVDTEDLSCGGTPELNNVFGEGRLDAIAAVAGSPVGPTGTLTGMVSDDETGEPVSGASLRLASADYERATSVRDDGSFTLSLPVGTYELRVSAYGYADRTLDEIQITEDAEVAVEVPMTRLPMVTVSGTISDGSGHGWPLYAGLTVPGYPDGTIYTDPVTGEYEVELPASTTFPVTINTAYQGYETITEDMVIGDTDQVSDFTLAASAVECTAVGYRSVVNGVFESFDTGALPDGWELTTARGDGWEFDDPGGRDNRTGGAGGFASIDSASGARLEDGWLMSPSADLTEVGEPLLSFRMDMIMSRGIVEADLSTDGGATWENVWNRSRTLRGPQLISLPLPQAAGEGDVRVRFHYRNDLSNNGWWQVDEVQLGERACEPVPGGLVVGNVTDGRSGDAINDATVRHSDNADEEATTVDTPDDEALDGGFYWLFSPRTGAQDYLAEHPVGQYASQSDTVDVAPSGVARLDFALPTGELEVDVDRVDTTLELGHDEQRTVTVTNVGTAPATFSLAEYAARDQADPSEAEWRQLHDAATNRTNTNGTVHDGELHVIGGAGGTALRNQVYDIAEDRWSFTGSIMPKRDSAAVVTIGDLIYVATGSGPPGRGAMDTVLIYDPEADTWSEGAQAPLAVAAAGYAVLDGELYVVGGRTDNNEDQLATATVMVYNPEQDAWRTVADYPEPAFWQACGTIDGLLYCAGGQGEEGQHLSRGYAYDPAADAWFRIPDLPLTVARGAYTAANGLLLMSSGDVGGFRSNQGFYYDPAAGRWGTLPNAMFPTERMASACGFYKVGGFLNPAIGTVPWAEQLPGFDDCDTSGGDHVPWLSTTPSSVTVQPGESVEVAVNLDAAAEGVDQPGERRAHLQVLEDTPFGLPPLEVAMDVTPPDSWGEVTGTVVGLGRCDAPGEPLADTTVHFEADGIDVTARTDAEGRFSYWFDSRTTEPGKGPFQRVEVSAQGDGWLSGTQTVMVRPGRTQTADFSLRRDEPCAAVSPGEITVEIEPGEERPVWLELDNRDGAAPYDYTVQATKHELDPLPISLAAEAAQEWTDAAEVPGGRMLYAHAQCPGRPDLAYLFGGIDATIETTEKSLRYDAGADSWSEIAPIPEAGNGAVAACEAGKIHVIGGDGTARHYVYDIARDSWSEAAPVPVPVQDAAAGAWNGKVYVIGGSDGEFASTYDEVHVYDIGADSWSAGPAMPVATKLAGFTQAGPYVYVVGGFDRNQSDPVLDAVQRLDLTTGEWSQLPPLAQPRTELGAVATDGALYAIAGSGPTDFGVLPTATVQRLDLSTDDGEWDVEAIDELPSTAAFNRAGFCTEGRSGGEIWTVGGQGSRIREALFHPVPGEICPTLATELDWLDLPEPGSVGADDHERARVLVDAGQLSPGESHTGTLLITTTDPELPEVRIPFTVTVREP